MHMTALQISNLKFISPALLPQITVINFHSAICLCGKLFGITMQEYNIALWRTSVLQATMLHTAQSLP